MGKIKVYVDGDYQKAQKIADVLYKALGQRTDLYVELDVISQEEIKALNSDNRHIDAVTDVLSFPMLDGIRGKKIYKKDYPYDYDEDEKAIFLGSVAICLDRAKEQAIEYGHSLQREMSYLFVHGLLHLFGYDHITDEDKKEMREKEEQVLLELGISR